MVHFLTSTRHVFTEAGCIRVHMHGRACHLAPRAYLFRRHHILLGSRTYVSSISYLRNPSEPLEIAVLGGGIAGLASAYFAADYYPAAKITLFESSNRFGGWVRSSEHKINGGNVVFEHGPRSLRPAQGTLSLIMRLGLKDKLLFTSKESPAARNRYVYLDNRLINVQQGIAGMFREPVLRKTLSEISRALIRSDPPSEELMRLDETVGQFFRRRGLDDTANNLVSAMLHGIYAGDIDELSAVSIFPTMVLHEARYGSLLRYMKQRFSNLLFDSSSSKLGNRPNVNVPTYLRAVTESIVSKEEFSQAMSASVYTLKGGLETLITALVKNLESNPRVKLVTGATAQSIQPAKEVSSTTTQKPDDKVRLTVRHNNQPSPKDLGTKIIDSEYHEIFSTISSASLGRLCPPVKDLLSQTPAATVCVVNLFYEKPDLLPVQGFGYLIPKSTPKHLNPEGALGVVFDTDATPSLDTASGTKLTVMLGGPHWKDIPEDLLPSKSEAIEMAKSVLAAHLGVTHQPILAQANIHTNCIPQYTVGHAARMELAAQTMVGNGHWSRVHVAGSWYNGVAINDCITSACASVIETSHTSCFGSEFPYKWHTEEQYKSLFGTTEWYK